MNVRFLSVPPGGVTGIGSLPFKDAAEAVAFVQDVSPLLPFWPQLPGRSADESALSQFLGSAAEHLSPRAGAPGLEVKAARVPAFLEALREAPAGMTAQSASGFFAFEMELLRDSFSPALGLKGQITGPVTLARYIFEAGRPLAENSEAVEALSGHLKRQAAWQVRKLKRFRKPLLVFVDEPGLATAGEAILQAGSRPLVAALSDLFDEIRDAGALAGMHCCGAFPPGLLQRAHPDIVSFDALAGIETFLASPGVHAYLQSGGKLAYGIVPTRPDPLVHTPEALFERWRAAATTFAGSFPVPVLAAGAMITATCGYAGADEASARASFHLAHRLSKLFEAAAAE